MISDRKALSRLNKATLIDRIIALETKTLQDNAAQLALDLPLGDINASPMTFKVASAFARVCAKQNRCSYQPVKNLDGTYRVERC